MTTGHRGQSSTADCIIGKDLYKFIAKWYKEMFLSNIADIANISYVMYVACTLYTVHYICILYDVEVHSFDQSYIILAVEFSHLTTTIWQIPF